MNVGVGSEGETLAPIRARVLSTPRLSLQPLQASDMSRYCAWFGDAELMEHAGARLGTEAARRAFRASLAMMNQPVPRAWLWVATERATGEDVGLMGLVTTSDVPAIGSIIVTPPQGRGFAYEALACIRDEGFRRLGMSVQSGCQLPTNLRSIGLMDKLGFKQVPGRPDRIHWHLDRASWMADLGPDVG